MTVYVDTYTRVILTIIAVLLTVVGGGLWLESPSVVSTAEAALPDEALQRNMMIDELQQIRMELRGISALLRSGDVQIQIVTPETSQPQEADGVQSAIEQQIGR